MNTREIGRLANRVELSANFAGSSNDRVGAENAFHEALSSTLTLLDLIDPYWLKDVLAAVENGFVATMKTLEANDGWADFLTTKTDLMHQIGIHQKAIERLGTITNQWDRSLVTYDQFVFSLEDLSQILGTPEDVLFSTFFPMDNFVNRIYQLANILYGITLMAGSDEFGLQNPAITCSSAKLVVDNINALSVLVQESS